MLEYQDCDKNLDRMIALSVMGFVNLQMGQMDPLIGFWDRGDHIELRRETRPASRNYGSEQWSPSACLDHAFEVLDKISIYWVMSAELYINGAEATCSFIDFSTGPKIEYIGAAVGKNAKCLAICKAAIAVIEKTPSDVRKATLDDIARMIAESGRAQHAKDSGNSGGAERR